MFLCTQGLKHAAGGLCLLTTGTPSNVTFKLRDNFLCNSQQWLTRSTDSFYKEPPESQMISLLPPHHWKSMLELVKKGKKIPLGLSLPLSSVTASWLRWAGNDSTQVLQGGWYHSQEISDGNHLHFPPFKLNLVNISHHPCLRAAGMMSGQVKCALMPLKHAAWLHSACDSDGCSAALHLETGASRTLDIVVMRSSFGISWRWWTVADSLSSYCRNNNKHFLFSKEQRFLEWLLMAPPVIPEF